MGQPAPLRDSKGLHSTETFISQLHQTNTLLTNMNNEITYDGLFFLLPVGGARVLALKNTPPYA